MSQVYKISDAIISSLGATTADHLTAMAAGKSGIAVHQHLDGLPAAVWAARISDDFLAKRCSGLENFTRYEQLLILAAKEALLHCSVDPSGADVLFIVASTKGNIDLLDLQQSDVYSEERLNLWKSSELVGSYFKNSNRPLTISQACISGVSALITAMDLLKQDSYKYAVVIGADVLSGFIYSGFNCLKALAPAPCRPFDRDREGLNLGEAAACMILSTMAPDHPVTTLRYGIASNDAHHLSAPSRVGEGLYRALITALDSIGYIPDFINTHGTATLFNDQMEAIAIQRAGLSHLPLTAFKGYFGHTLGAAGLIDAVISARCMEECILYPVSGFENLGVTEAVNVQTRVEKKDLHSCIKTASGFGGCNAVLVMEFDKQTEAVITDEKVEILYIQKYSKLLEHELSINGVSLYQTNREQESQLFFPDLYRFLEPGYLKFFKMDNLSKTLFLAAEALLKDSNVASAEPNSRVCSVLYNGHSSLDTDTHFQAGLDPEAFFPSPALFVYTLPNIASGELCIRNKFMGENMTFIDQEFDIKRCFSYVSNLFTQNKCDYCICGWLDYARQKEEAVLFLVSKQKTNNIFNINNLEKIYHG